VFFAMSATRGGGQDRAGCEATRPAERAVVIPRPSASTTPATNRRLRRLPAASSARTHARRGATAGPWPCKAGSIRTHGMPQRACRPMPAPRDRRAPWAPSSLWPRGGDVARAERRDALVHGTSILPALTISSIVHEEVVARRLLLHVLYRLELVDPRPVVFGVAAERNL